MDDSQSDLWRRLDAFQLDDPAASLPFSRRLARENGWDVGFARRVVDEYKRFVFLAMTAGHEVTPSDEVDQAWHLHLTYTRSYWGELCGAVLGRPLHHGPTKGGHAEGARFEDQYERTLASYRAAFDADAPSDIWPPSAVRFGEAADFVRVNRQRTWLVTKPWRSLPSKGHVVFCSLAAAPPLLLAKANWFLWAVGGYVVLALLYKVFANRRRGRGGNRRRLPGGDTGCDSGSGDGVGITFDSDSGCGGGGCGGCGGCGGD
ncbi:glycine-rich domain-containing protein [Botrimarina colliarenosi]|nr:hypothetical protein [Botrimarina colliarenosi]